MSPELSKDTAYRLLSDSQRQHLLSLLSQDDQGRIDGLAREIAAREEDIRPKNVSEKTQQRITISLIHNHLPRLAEHNIVSYDQDSKRVVLMDVFGELEANLSDHTDDDSALYQLFPDY